MFLALNGVLGKVKAATVAAPITTIALYLVGLLITGDMPEDVRSAINELVTMLVAAIVTGAATFASGYFTPINVNEIEAFEAGITLTPDDEEA